uniref:Uncharacterized protein n=1 Tax=Anguilla anguilla TaxID=7936 RepID=A0A0E9XNG7_ANGAN
MYGLTRRARKSAWLFFLLPWCLNDGPKCFSVSVLLDTEMIFCAGS